MQSNRKHLIPVDKINKTKKFHNHFLATSEEDQWSFLIFLFLFCDRFSCVLSSDRLHFYRVHASRSLIIRVISYFFTPFFNTGDISNSFMFQNSLIFVMRQINRSNLFDASFFLSLFSFFDIVN